MPTTGDGPPVGHPAGVDRCGWPVRLGSRGWRCNAPALHDHEHRLYLGPGWRVAARSAGFSHPEIRPAR